MFPLIPLPFLFPLLIVIFAIIIFAPIVAVTLSSELMLLFQVAAAIMVFNWVRNVVGPGIVSYAIAGVLIYIFVFVLPQFTLGLYMIWTILGLGVFSIIFWGLTLFRMAQ